MPESGKERQSADRLPGIGKVSGLSTSATGGEIANSSALDHGSGLVIGEAAEQAYEYAPTF
ncbi:hypothetical protein RCCGEPOP_04411 [Rhizobium sp. Pop5]|nr:hypothetical protein RCCGEPOP_04411 [Rhizobium sp. Pop5]